MKFLNKIIYSLFIVTLPLLNACSKEIVPKADKTIAVDNAIMSSTPLSNSQNNNNNMTIYNWRYMAGAGFTAAEENDLQIAVNRADWPSYKSLLLQLKNGEVHNVNINLSPLPVGSPHQIDVKTEFFNYPNQQYLELEFIRYSKPADEIFINFKNNGRLQIRATEAGYARLLIMQANAERFASIYENTTNVFIQKNDANNNGNSNAPFITAKLVMWGVNDVGEIVYN